MINKLFAMRKYGGMVLLLCLVLANMGYSQGEHNNKTAHETAFHHHSIGVLLSHSLISQGISNGDRGWLGVPSWAINYNYRFNENWSLGLHSDIIIEVFVVEGRGNSVEALVREYPFSTVIAGTYKPTGKLGFVLGAGAEWERQESFAMVRLGLDYGLHLRELKLEVLFGVNYDILIEAYDTYNIGIGIAKLF
ncbi:MAG: hypothetical protein ABF293_08660 [Flavobacteriaceae bacterium]